jgi:hypothetical protein
MKLAHIAIPLMMIALLAVNNRRKQEGPYHKLQAVLWKKSVARNKKLVASEEDQIKTVIKKIQQKLT